MTAPSRTQSCPVSHLNSMERGRTYRATTDTGTTTGRYLGVEVAYGDWSILLSGRAGAVAVAIDDVTAIDAAA